MAHYCDKQILRQLIIEAQEKGTPSEGLLAMSELILKGVANRYSFPLTEDDKQDWVLWMFSHLHYLMPEENCFAYLSTCAANHIRGRLRIKVMTTWTDAGLWKSEDSGR